MLPEWKSMSNSRKKEHDWKRVSGDTSVVVKDVCGSEIISLKKAGLKGTSKAGFGALE